MIELFANIGNPDQTPHSVASDLGLHYLPVTCFGVSSLQWVNSLPFWSKNLNKSILLPVDVSKHCWMSGKQFTPWSDAAICCVWSTVLSTSLRKTFFAWHFILNGNILFWLTISYQKPFVFSVSVFCSQIFTLKLNLRPNIGLTYAISIVKWFFRIFVSEIFFLLFFAEFELMMFHNNIVKISEKLNKQNLLKICLQVTYPADFWMICILFYYGKKNDLKKKKKKKKKK